MRMMLGLLKPSNFLTILPVGWDVLSLPVPAKGGRQLFFGAAGCANCHNGPLLSDQKFYALGLPAFGPGRTRRFDRTARDVGRMGESDDIKDAYRFKTPRLCNIALTAPYGHNGAYRDLYGIVRHHLDPAAMRAVWQPNLAALPAVPWLEAIDFVIQSDSAKSRVRRRNWILKR